MYNHLNPFQTQNWRALLFDYKESQKLPHDWKTYLITFIKHLTIESIRSVNDYENWSLYILREQIKKNPKQKGFINN